MKICIYKSIYLLNSNIKKKEIEGGRVNWNLFWIDSDFGNMNEYNQRNSIE